MCLNQDQKTKPQPHVCQTFQLRLEKLVYLIKQVLFQSIGYKIVDADILGNIIKSMPCRPLQGVFGVPVRTC
jgi:hypothetical protein